MHRAACDLRGCIVPADIVGVEDDLLPHVPRIIEAGYVFVRAQDRTVSGIITTTDLSSNFLTLAEPFLLIGEVERKLRQIVAANFALEEVQSAKDERDESRKIESVEDLTLGEIIRMFESKERWVKIQLAGRPVGIC